MPRLSRLLLKTALAGSPLVLPAAEPTGDTVTEVVLDGTVRIHPNKILGQLSTRPGSRLQDIVLNDDIARLEAMGYFLKPEKRVERLAPGQVRVIFTVVELPYVSEVRWEGAGYFTRQALEKVVQTRRGSYLNPLQVEVDVRNQTEKLRQQNYLHATVTHRIEVEPDSQIGAVVFTVDKGDKVKVGRLLFPGMPRGAHRYFLQPRLFNQQARLFEPDLVTWDHEIVEAYVQEAGYLDAEVAKPRVEFFDQVKAWEERARLGPALVPDGKRKDRVVITYAIEPGERYTLGSVRFIGNTVITEEALVEAFAMPRGAWFERKELEEAKRRALGLLRDNGYALARFIEDPVVDREARTVDLTLQLYEGDIYSIGRIDIFGNTITKDAVVRRALYLEPGERWSDTDRNKSRREISRTGVFRTDPSAPVRIEPEFSSARPSTIDPETTEVDLAVDVEEEKTGRFSFNIGFSTAQGVIGQIQFSESNFDLWGLIRRERWRGAGHKLTASASWSKDRTNLSVNWRNPHLMDSRYSLGVALSRSDDTNLDWDELRHSASVTLGRNFFDNDLRLSVGTGIYHLDIDDIDDEATDSALDGEGTYLNTYLQFNQTLDLLDNPSLPTRGINLKFSERVTGGPMPADDEFLSIDIKATGYLPLMEGELGGVTFLRLRQRNRWLEPIGDSDVVPFYDRLYGGGPAPKHRGFDNLDLGPTSVNRNGFVARDGGVTEWLTTLELVYPLQGTNDGLRALLFADLGNIWSEDESIDLGDLRHAVGIGLRFPRGFPVALDYAWLLDPKDGEADSQFHFSLAGFAF